MSETVFSVVVPTYKRPDLLERCLERLAPDQQLNAPAYEIIVSDDDPEGSAKKILSKRFSNIKWNRGPGKGPAANRNAGASSAKSNWLVFLDDDCEPTTNWLAAYDQARSASDSDVLEGKTIADRPKQRLDEESPINETGGYLWSCNFAIRKDCFNALNGFDESFPAAAMEDVDLRVRLNKHGAKTRFVGSAIVVHPWRRTKGTKFLRKKLECHYTYWKKNPEEKPDSMVYYFLFTAVRTFIKVTVPGIIKYKGRGAMYAIRTDATWAMAALSALFRKT